jgi:hypothetical protein
MNWFTRIFSATYTTKQESVQLAVVNSLVENTSTLQLIVSSDKDTIGRLKELIKTNCYTELAKKNGNVVALRDSQQLPHLSNQVG